MREIKFRCYLKDSYIERKKDYWWYEQEKANRIRKVHSIHLNTRKVIVSTLWGGNRSVGFDDVELMQFTGLYDKNKKPIYEGDIIDIHQTINGYNQFVIEYKNYGFSAKYYNQKENKAIRWYEYDLDELFDVNESEKEIEVIGNIHDKERE